MGDRPPAEVIPAVAQAVAATMDGHVGLLLQLLFELSRRRPVGDPDGRRNAEVQQDAAHGMRSLPLVATYLAEQMAAGRLRRIDPALAVQALVGPTVMHLLMRAQAGSGAGRGHGAAAPLEEAVEELAGLWLRAMTPAGDEHDRHDQPASRSEAGEMAGPAELRPGAPEGRVLRPVVTLAEAAGLEPDRARALLGTKAANLARLAAAGFPVPAGVVVTAAGAADLDAVWARLRAAAADLAGRPGQRYAVRSSGAAEDLEGASFAGQYETVLDVGLDELPAAVARVLDSAASARLSAYRQARPRATAGVDPGPRLAVLVQVMVPARAARVAFTADPLSGDRGEVVISAVRGLGERLVGGEAGGDRWVVRDGQARCARRAEQAITVDQAREVAALARRVEACFAAPQDIEWAIDGDGVLWLLQARPMTALPDTASWTPPAPGYWMRNFRLGEWLPEAMTPLFADWLLVRIEEGYLAATRRHLGASLGFPYAAINGWYYTAVPRLSPGTVVAELLRGRGRLLRFVRYALLGPGRDPVRADRRLLGHLAEEWRTQFLPHYRETVEAAGRRVETATPAQLAGIVDEVGGLAGEYLWLLAVVGGAAWKTEGVLARFFREHLAATVEASVQELLAGLPGARPELLPYAVESLDWGHPTVGEQGVPAAAPSGRHEELARKREALTDRCTRALADRPELQARFTALLEVAQRYAVFREQQARQFTLGWPLLRRCALRLGEALCAGGAIEDAGDVFFLIRAELDQPSAALREVVTQRRATWERQRRLLAPLAIGQPPRLLVRQLLATVDAVRGSGPVPEGAIVGEPASPGRATGPARIVYSPREFDRFRPGEVLVARATTPAWSPLFASAAAVVTDSGTLAAHASLVAREYGIPAVVGTGDATVRLADGQQVTVDGSSGQVLTRS